MKTTVVQYFQRNPNIMDQVHEHLVESEWQKDICTSISLQHANSDCVRGISIVKGNIHNNHKGLG
jgi:hypothetical protein